jgi:hypothetical protein
MSTSPDSSAACPACRSTRVVSGRLEDTRAGKLFLRIDGLHPDPWKFVLVAPPLLLFDPGIRACLACGLLWGSADHVEINAEIKKHGTAELKARVLEPGESLPRPAAASGPEAGDLPLPGGPEREGV